MISAENAGLTGESGTLQGDVIVIRDNFQNPIAIVLSVTPEIAKIYTLEQPELFKKLLHYYGITPSEELPVVKLKA